MKREVKKFTTDLERLRNVLVQEYDDLTAKMQTYDITAFQTELQSAFSYYSLRYFDEDKFKIAVENKYGIDITNPVVKELTIDNIYYYSTALVTLNALKDYIKANDIQTEDYDE